MTRKEKLNMIEDVLEVELGSLKESDLLSKISEYDSMSKLDNLKRWVIFSTF